MKRQKLFIAFIMLLIIFPSVAQEACEAAAGEPLVLGAIFPQDVLLLSDTSEWWRGVETMTAAVNSCGGVNGRPVEYRYQEAATEEEALTAFEALEAETVPLIVASGFAPVNAGLMQATEEAGIVLWEVTERPTDSSNAWTFYAHPSEAEVGAELADYVQSELIPSLGITEARLALIYEERPRAAAIAEGFRHALPFEPMLDVVYERQLDDAYPIAIEMRENEINIVVVISFQNDSERLWRAMLQADANVSAWLHLGGSDYRNGIESRLGNTEGLLLVGANGFEQWIEPSIYAAYIDYYQNSFGEATNQESNLSALGVYILLRDILPYIDGETINASSIRAIMEARPRGSWWDSAEPALLVEQNQNGRFCILAPRDFPTCSDGLQAFPTWRQRVMDN